ncbi:MAG: hypothetical protein K8S87_05900 [Planctomycetes bacterium]|nr:hypothetical protein [Planctomycetota bacterium]
MLGGFLPGWKLFWNLVGLAAFILLAIFVYTKFFAPPADITSSEEKCMSQIRPQITKDIFDFAHAENNKRDLRGFVVSAVKGDTPNERFKHEITKAAKSAEGITLKEAPMSEKFKNFFKDTENVQNLTNSEQALKYIRETAGVDFVIFGNVHPKNYPKNKQAEIWLDVVLQSEDKNYVGKYHAVSWHESVDEGAGFFGSIGGFLWRLLLFAALAFSIPIVSFPLNVGLMKLDSNALNGVLLVIYTVLAGFLVILLAGFSFTGWSITLSVLAMIASGFWNFRVLTVTADSTSR